MIVMIITMIVMIMMIMVISPCVLATPAARGSGADGAGLLQPDALARVRGLRLRRRGRVDITSYNIILYHMIL